jgi:hypothetical protein
MVHVRQPGDGNYTKRFATVIMLLRGDGHLCRLCVIFRGKGRTRDKAEKASYHPDITVLWQPKAWNDTATQLLYDDLVLLPAFKDAGVGSGDPAVEGLAFSDNLSAHKYSLFCLFCLFCLF